MGLKSSEDSFRIVKNQDVIIYDKNSHNRIEGDLEYDVHGSGLRSIRRSIFISAKLAGNT